MDTKPWILCMFSGGLDSTGVVYELLTNEKYKDYNIHIHSMTLNNCEGRGGAEYMATLKIKKWFQNNCREFEFTRSTHEYIFMKDSFIWDADYVYFMASQITRCSSRKYTHQAIGATKTDIDNPRDNQTVRFERARAIRDAVYYGSHKTVPQTVYTVGDMTKKDIWDMLPEDLRTLTWSCRTPNRDEKNNYIPCGKCITCKDIIEIG